MLYLSSKLRQVVYVDFWPEPRTFTFREVEKLAKKLDIDLDAIWRPDSRHVDLVAFIATWTPLVERAEQSVLYCPTIWNHMEMRKDSQPSTKTLDHFSRAIFEVAGVLPIRKRLPEEVIEVSLPLLHWGNANDPKSYLCFLSELNEYIEILKMIAKKQNRSS